MKKRLRPLSSKSKRLSIPKRRKSSRANSGSVRHPRKIPMSSISNNYFINNINIGNLKSRISGNVHQHSNMIMDMRKRLMHERRKRLTVGGLVQNSVFLAKAERAERETQKKQKKIKSYSFAQPKGGREKRKSRATKINEILSTSKEK